MNQATIPAEHRSVMPYLIVNDASGFVAFMQTVFGAKETLRKMRDDMHIMHGEMEVAGSVLMFADSTETYAAQPAGLFIYVDDADRTFDDALRAGATVVMEVADQSYGRSGGIKDPAGNTWWITAVAR